jgi:P27 family predicted phage terminase small subunit
MAGRPRGAGAPTALKLLRGERNTRINHDEPVPDDGIPECPTDNPEVQEVWDYTIKQLIIMRTITMADRDALYTYCEQIVQYRHAAEMVREDGPIILGGTGPKRHPGLAIMRESASIIKMFGHAFGLTPSARTAIKVADQQPKRTEAGASRLLSG